MEKFRNILDRTLEAILSILLVVMVGVALYAVLSRHFLSSPASFTTEFLRFALLWLSVFAAAYCFGKKAHIEIEFLKDKIKGKAKMVLLIFIELIIIFFAAAVMIHGGIQGVILGMAENSPTLGITIGYIYLCLPISGAFIIIYSIMDLIKIIKNSPNVDDSNENPTTSSTM